MKYEITAFDPEGYFVQYELISTWTELQEEIKDLRTNNYSDIRAACIDELSEE